MKSLKNRKAFAIMQFKKAVNPVEPEEKLIFGILAQAVEDAKHKNPNFSSTKDWRAGNLIPICDALGLNYEFVCRVMAEQRLFKL